MVDPRHRPTINDVIERLQEIAGARNVNLKAPLELGMSTRPERRKENIRKPVTSCSILSNPTVFLVQPLQIPCDNNHNHNNMKNSPNNHHHNMLLKRPLPEEAGSSVHSREALPV